MVYSSHSQIFCSSSQVRKLCCRQYRWYSTGSWYMQAPLDLWQCTAPLSHSLYYEIRNKLVFMSVGLDVKINCNAAFQWLDERGAGLPAASET